MQRRSLLLGVLLLPLFACTGARGDDTSFQALEKEFRDAQMAWYQAMSKLENDDGAIDMDRMPPPPEGEYAPRFRAYAETHAGTPEAIPALGWLIGNPAMGPAGPDATQSTWAFEQLGRDHAGDAAMAEVIPSLEYAGWMVGRAPIVELCEKVIEVNSDREVRAGSMFTLAATLYSEMIQGPGKDVERAETLFRTLASDYGDTPYGPRADAYLFELDHLQVGMKAPEIAGEDVAGNAIMLSQFEGQVVVLDFWGFW